MDFWVNQTFNGLSYAALLFLLAGGMTLIFGVMRIINIAQGTFYVIGGFILPCWPFPQLTHKESPTNW